MQQIVETDEGSDPQFLPVVESHQQPLPANQLFSNTGVTTGSDFNDHVAGTSGYFGPIVTWNDISMCSLIASGSFASVYKVFINDTTIPGVTTGSRAQLFHRVIPTSFGEMEDFDMGDNEAFASQGTMVTSSHHSHHSLTSPSSSPKPYALKKLNSIIANTPAKINHGIKGMIFEAHLLSQILPLQEQGRSHPNIVRMIGMSPNFTNDPVNGFLILEYLVETLENRLMRWTNRQKLMMNTDKQSNEQQQHHQNLFSVQRLFDTHNNNSQKKCTTVREQLTRTKHVGCGIANAIQYLHENHVLYRDLKPSNVGFDARGTVKLFDFDLSRRFNCDDIDDSDAAKQLTGCIGSLRYMSPECAQGKPYGFSSDVHSFAILLWEICALQRPFEHVHTTPGLVKAAFLGNERPSLRKIASPALRQLLQKCWNPNPAVRPTMPSIVGTFNMLFSCTDGRSNNGGSPTSLHRLMALRNGSM